MSKRTPDPGDKARALKLAGHATAQARGAESKQQAAIVFAADQGASLREIAEATGIPHVTVKRILERARQHA